MAARNRKSRPRPFTLLASQRQRKPPCDPRESANPVMLLMGKIIPFGIETVVRRYRDESDGESSGRGAKLSGRGLLFDFAPLGDVSLMFRGGLREHMAAGPIGDEIELLRIGG